MEQLGLVLDDSNPIANGIVTFIAFALFEFLPLIPFIVGRNGTIDAVTYMGISIAIATVILFILGYLKSYLIGLPIYKRFISAIQMVLMAAVATAARFGIGKIF